MTHTVWLGLEKGEGEAEEQDTMVVGDKPWRPHRALPLSQLTTIFHTVSVIGIVYLATCWGLFSSRHVPNPVNSGYSRDPSN